MIRRSVLSALVLLPAALSGCGNATDVHTYKYKLTLTVDVNGQARTGFGVVQETVGDVQSLGAGSTMQASAKGQATFVDLGDGRLLFVLLTSTDAGRPPSITRTRTWAGGAASVLQEAYGYKPDFPGPPGTFDGLLRQRGPKPLAPEQMPDFVTFRDNNDPSSLVVVDPTNLGATFGPGVKLTRATIELTDEPITTGLKTRLPWLRSARNYIDGGMTQETSVGFLANAFRSGI